MEAAPINPSDIGPLFAPSYGGIGRFDGIRHSVDAAGRAQTALPVPDRTFQRLRGGRGVGRPARAGNEGAGRVVGAGKGAAAQALKGKLVAAMGMGGSYAQHAVCKVEQCLEHHKGTNAEEAASSFVNPLTALGMIKTMRAEGHTGIVHTAAASQLGQMLVKICKSDGIPLVNVVRRPEQVALLESIGAEHALDSSAEDFEQRLADAVGASGATVCFDALGGGTLGFQIIKAMETAAVRAARGKGLTGYGSTTFKKLYIYGGLNAGEPLILRPHGGMGGFSWGVAGFLLNEGERRVASLSIVALRSVQANPVLILRAQPRSPCRRGSCHHPGRQGASGARNQHYVCHKLLAASDVGADA
eukprot:COSAG01_NODE_4484_length_4983_cov_9.058149_3_plen_359_part_00